MNDIEKKLIIDAQKGNQDAFGKLIFEHERKIYAIAFKIFKNEADAYDVSQEICIKIFQKIDQFRFESEFSTWIYRLATNTAIDEYRKIKRKIEKETSYDDPIDTDQGKSVLQIPDQKESPEEEYIKKEQAKLIWEGIDALNPEHKDILILKDIEQKSYQEIVDILNINLGTVKSRLARARIALKKNLINLWEHNLL